jgi:PEGA domain
MIRARLFALLLLFAAPARADEEPGLVEARRLFVVGLDGVKAAQWSEALAAFEKSHALRPHAVTLFNIGACERALGRYTRARLILNNALEMSAATGGTLPASLVEEARGFVAEIERVLTHLAVTLDPPEAAIAVDGRPLEPILAGDGAGRTFVAGTQPPGPGAPAERPTFELVADPGTHVFTLARKGYRDVLLNRTFAPGEHATLALALDRLPVTIRVASTLDAAIVRVNDIDVGAAPVTLSRPAGSYRVAVARPGYVTYRTDVTLAPGAEANLEAALEPVKPSLFRRWWFWTAAGAVLAGVGVAAYFAAAAANPPKPDGGGLQWVVDLR